MPPILYPTLSKEENLPFRIRRAKSPQDYRALCQLRANAYARHAYHASLPFRLRTVDASDENSVILLAESKESGMIVGTVRLNSSFEGNQPLLAGMHTAELEGEPSLYVDRFAVEQGPASDVAALALLKAAWHFANYAEVTWMLAAALAPLARRYRMVGLRTLKGCENGFQATDLHAGTYFTVGGRLSEIPNNVHKVAPFLAPFFGNNHPDILLPVPDTSCWWSPALASKNAESGHFRNNGASGIDGVLDISENEQGARAA
jgi:hypothetical protein